MSRDEWPYERRDDGSDLVKIVAAVFIAIIAGYFVIRTYEEWKLQQDLKAASAVINQSLATFNAQTQAQLEHVRQRQIEAQYAMQQRQQQQAYQRAEAERRQREAAAAASNERRRKDEAWEAFYKPKAACSNPPTHEVFMECSNAHIRAKTQFEKLWESQRRQQAGS